MGTTKSNSQESRVLSKPLVDKQNLAKAYLQQFIGSTEMGSEWSRSGLFTNVFSEQEIRIIFPYSVGWLAELVAWKRDLLQT